MSYQFRKLEAWSTCLLQILGSEIAQSNAKVLFPHNLGPKYVFPPLYLAIACFAAGSHDLSQAEKRITVV